MKARHRHALSLAALATGFTASAAISASTLDAQSTLRRVADPNAPRMMVPTLRSTEKNLGVQAADAIRSRLNQDFPLKALWVIPKSDISGTLEAAGFPTTEALSPTDASSLAKQLRADEYIEGTVTKSGSNFRIESVLVKPRGQDLLRQPLPASEGGNMTAAAAGVGKEVKAARAQFDGENQCFNLARERKFAEAIKAGYAGVASYQKGTIVRACILNAMVAAQAPSDSILKVAQEMLAIDRRNRTALTLAAPAYMAKGDTTQAINTWSTLVSIDPGNTRVVEPVVSQIAASGRAPLAVPIIDAAVAENPGDSRLLDLQFRLLLAARDWKRAITAAESSIQTDTALADTLYFSRLAAAYTADSQPQKAAEAVARGVAKFPNNAGLFVLQSQTLRAAGQTQQSIDAIRKALAINPKIERGWLQLAQAQVDLNQFPEALASLRSAAQSGDTLAPAFALSIGNQRYKAGVASKTAADFRTAMSILTLADSITTAPEGKAQAKFLNGVAALQLGQIQLNAARETKSCPLAKEAQGHLVTAQINLPAGGRFAPEPTKQALTALGQLAPYGDQLAASLCK